MSIIGGLLIVIVVYILVNVSYFSVMSIEELITTPAVAAVQYAILINIHQSNVGTVLKIDLFLIICSN